MDLNEGVVDGDNVDVVVLNRIAEDDTADTTETVDTNLDGCHDSGDDVSMCWGNWQANRAFDELEAGSMSRCNGWMQIDAEKRDAGTYMIVFEVSGGACVCASCDDCYDQEDSEEKEGFIGGVFIR